MTNREWLSTLTDHELAEFLSIGLLVTNELISYPCYVSIEEVKRSNLKSVEGIINWLNELCPYKTIRRLNHDK